jgi:hypothetical protein
MSCCYRYIDSSGFFKISKTEDWKKLSNETLTGLMTRFQLHNSNVETIETIVMGSM